MAKFETISKYAGHNELIPVRKTQEAAGYDFVVAEDTLIPPYEYLMNEIVSYIGVTHIDEPMTLEEIAKVTKAADAKVTLIPTGVKCELDPGTYLELSVRSSCPLKHWLIMGNSVGVIDGDYYNNEDNEGHIFFQIINLSPVPIILKKGDAIGQGIIKEYKKTEDDVARGVRKGGFGSTDKQVLASAT
jgi:dUTP pyrophosphatase